MVYYVMQVDCFKRNYRSSVCIIKCPFRNECDNEYIKHIKQRIEDNKARDNDRFKV